MLNLKIERDRMSEGRELLILKLLCLALHSPPLSLFPLVSASLVLLKTTYSSADAKHMVLWEEELCKSRPDVAVTQIEVLRDHVYVGTTKGLYRFTASGCSQYRECSECVGARDPHCAYDKGAATCVPVGEHNRASTSLLQGLKAESVMDVCGTTPTIKPGPTNGASVLPIPYSSPLGVHVDIFLLEI